MCRNVYGSFNFNFIEKDCSSVGADLQVALCLRDLITIKQIIETQDKPPDEMTTPSGSFAIHTWKEDATKLLSGPNTMRTSTN